MSRKPFSLDQEYRGRVDRPLPEGARTDSDIDEMFETAFARSPDSEFLTSIHTWWEEKGFLTASQYEALEKWSHRA